MGHSWLVLKISFRLAGKVLRTHWCVSRSVSLQLFIWLLFWGMPYTARSSSTQDTRFPGELQKQAVLCMPYPREDESNPVTEVIWRKREHQPRLILQHKPNVKNPTIFYGGYRNRTHYYFQNNTLILEAITEEDEGVYEVSLLYKNTSVWNFKFHLSIVTPPSDPSIAVQVNDSQATLVLKCEVEKGTDVFFHWLKNGQPLLQDERHYLRERNSTLRVTNMTSADCVNYTCVVTNGLARREGLVQLNGSNVEMCYISTATSDLTLRVILSITAVVICGLGLCVVILCINRHYQVGQRRLTDGADMTAQEVVALPYVYTDFIPNGQMERPRASQIEDFGYSTIGGWWVGGGGWKGGCDIMLSLSFSVMCDHRDACASGWRRGGKSFKVIIVLALTHGETALSFDSSGCSASVFVKPYRYSPNSCSSFMARSYVFFACSSVSLLFISLRKEKRMRFTKET
ncbi:hypothetical protein JZ751_022778 [Albula glossodonta]|uniref:Ig-like domain-containing protein n=1 Tax=Albula glossodonta TaxID=121402 RepID=A0A8T2PN28_9TELE|nr:hypothetical protein JZ751_022778 [Albula glossodonta]